MDTNVNIMDTQMNDIISYFEGFNPTLDQNLPVLDNESSVGQNVQVLDNVSYVEVDSAQVLQSNQPEQKEMKFAEFKEVNCELSLEKLTNPEANFQVKIAEAGKNESYTHSDKLKKTFTSIEKPCNFEMSFNPISAVYAIVRVMLVCANKLCQPLSQCSYHAKNDKTEFKNHAILRTDGDAEYVGTPEGKHFRDRLALKIHMENSSQKTITLEFKCLSSCHKIPKISTALVFTLEDPIGGQLLGREVIPIQISKNFKRDMETAENAIERPRPSKKRKQSPNSNPEPAPSAPATEGPSGSNSVAIDLDLDVPLSIAVDFLKYSEQFFEAKLYQADKATEKLLMPCLKKIRRQAAKMEQRKDQ